MLLTALCWEQETFDLVGLLLMIRINYHHQLIMNKRRIPCLDDYLDRTNLLLWPRFKVSALLCPLPQSGHLSYQNLSCPESGQSP